MGLWRPHQMHPLSAKASLGRADLPLFCGCKFGWSVTSCLARRMAVPSLRHPSPCAPGFPLLPSGSSGSQQAAQKSWEVSWPTHLTAVGGNSGLTGFNGQKLQTGPLMKQSLRLQSKDCFLRLGVLPRGSLLSVTLILKLVIFWPNVVCALINSSQATCFGF